MDIQTGLSAVSLLAFVVLGALGYRLQQRVTKIERERRDEESEERRRADVTAFFEPKPGAGGSRNFVLLNRGPALAWEMTFEMTSADGRELPLVKNGPPLPIPVLDVGQWFEILAVASHQGAAVVDVELSWRDETGQQSKSLRLNVV